MKAGQTAVDLLKAGSLQMIHLHGDRRAFVHDESRFGVRRPSLSGAVYYDDERGEGGGRGGAHRHRDPIRVWSLQEIHAEKAAVPARLIKRCLS